MQLDIYRRAEPGGKHSYLAVPAGRELPQEVTDVAWASVDRGRELDAQTLRQTHHIDDAEQQIADKGYAITGVTQQLQDG